MNPCSYSKGNTTEKIEATVNRAKEMITKQEQNKLGLSCAKLNAAWASYLLAKKLMLAISLCLLPYAAKYVQLCLYD